MIFIFWYWVVSTFVFYYLYKDSLGSSKLYRKRLLWTMGPAYASLTVATVLIFIYPKVS